MDEWQENTKMRDLTLFIKSVITISKETMYMS